MADDIVTELRKLSQAWNEELVDNPVFLRAANEIKRLRAIVADADYVICHLIGNNSPDEYMGVSEILKRMRQ